MENIAAVGLRKMPRNGVSKETLCEAREDGHYSQL